MINHRSVKTFIKAQFSAFAGGVVDYMTMIFFTELAGIHYTLSIAIGGLVGALVNFSINRFWTFKLKDQDRGSVNSQLLKFCIVLSGSILLKTSGTYILTETLGIDYRVSRLVVDLIVSILFNYTLQKYWVFEWAKVK